MEFLEKKQNKNRTFSFKILGNDGQRTERRVTTNASEFH